MRNPIPRTPLQRYYKRVCDMSYAQRLELAGDLVRDPSPLVEEFRASVAAFEPYANPEAFYSNPGRAPKAPRTRDAIVRTHHVAWHLRQQSILEVHGAPALRARYVDYEIAPTRTTGHAISDDGGSWRSGLFVDLLLASCDDGTPIVGELKIRAD
ncbi:MAG: hypothetical protein ACXVUE_08855 [Solirubrobacteraceae bacterium]